MRHKLLTVLVTMAVVALFACSAGAADKGNAPVAHWRFDEGGGPTAYDEIGSNDGTLTAGATGANDAVGEMWSTQGKVGGAVELDGDDTISIASVINSYPFTVSMWVTHDNSWDPGGGTMDELFNMSIGSQRVSLGITDYWVASGEITLMYGGTSHWGATRPSATGSSDWNHIVWVVYGSNNSSHKVYVNGVSQTMTDNGGAHGGTAGWNIGSNSAGAEHWPGKIDDVKVYNYTRTPAQVMVDYNAGAATHAGAGTDPNEGNPPVGYWKLDENTGTNVYDRSGNGNDGTFVSSPTWVTGKYGSALNFDGAGANDDYVSVSSVDADLLGAAGTISAWAYPIATGTNRYVFCSVGPSTNRFYIQFSGGDFMLWRGNPDSGVTILDNAPLNQWHHLTLAWDSTTLYGYLNGQFINSTSYVNSGTTGGNSKIGSQGTDKTFPGKIDEVKVYNYKRTPAQITYDYNKGAPVAHYKFDEGAGTIAHNDYSTAGSGAAPVGWWRMDESAWNGTANEVVDSSGNGNHGVRGGDATTTSSKIGPYAGTFDGTGDYVQGVSSNDITGDNLQTITMSAWIKTSSTTNQYMAALKRSASHSTLISLCSNYGGSGYLGFLTRNSADTTHTSLEHNGSYSDGAWHHVVGVVDGATRTLYIDGVQRGTDSDGMQSVTGNTAYFAIGAFSSTQLYFNGQVDDVRIYNYARTAEQIYNDYKSTHGTLVGDTKFVDGKLGKALEFDGTGDYVKIPISSTLGVGNSGTISFWANQSAWNTSVDEGAVGNGIGYTADNTIYVSVHNSVALHYRYGGTGQSGNKYLNYTGSDSWANDSWHHIAAVWDRVSSTTNLYLYVDGAQVDSDSTSLLISLSSRGWNIGGNNVGTGYYSGKIDDVRIYNYALATSQVAEDYAAGAARLGAQSAGEADPWGGALPVGHWKLDENTGVLAQDASENNNNGTLGGDGAGTDVPTWTHGKQGPALSFDGGDYVLVDTADFRSPDLQGSISAWIKLNTTGSYWVIFGSADYASANRYIELFGRADSKIGFAQWNADGVNDTHIYGNTVLSAGIWYHVAVTSDGSTYKMYVNGKEESLTVQTGTNNGDWFADTANRDNWTIGVLKYNNTFISYMPGLIDDVRIYNYALTQAQVSWLYNKGKPVGHWRFNESSGTDAWDESGNNNATVTIGATGSQTTIAAARTAGATGKFGRCMSFDGTDDYVSYGSTGLPTAVPVTFEAWVNLDSLSQNGIVLSYSNTLAFAFGIHSDGILAGISSNKVGVATPSSVLTAGAWHHWAIVYTSTSDIKLYIDGKDVSSTSTNYYLAANNNIGARANGTAYPLDGKVDDVRIYNYARTAAQILQDFNAGAAARLSD